MYMLNFCITVIQHMYGSNMTVRTYITYEVIIYRIFDGTKSDGTKLVLGNILVIS